MPLKYPKPTPRLVDRMAKKRDDEQRLREFREAVWRRDEGKCRMCGRKVVKTLALVPERGEVHHLRGRRVAPEDRYNVKRAVLLCLEDHGRIQRHEASL